jgi:ABC-type lipoprotein export system ATPase subunit
VPEANGAVLLELGDVEKRFEATTDAPETVVLRGVSLRIERGESVAIVGPSGSGKSTLLNIIGALDRPTRGSVRFDGRDVTALGEKDLATLRASEVGFIFQLHHLLPQCTVLENVLVPTLATPGQKRREPAETRARRLLERVGLGHRLSHRPGQLSGGERQRVAVVRALINEPKLLLADEPTGSLDRVSAENLSQLLRELNREEGVALVVVTHSQSLAGEMSRTYEMCDGALLALGDRK